MVRCPIWSFSRLSGCGYARAGKPPQHTARRCNVIDNPITVARLLAQMHDHLPIPAFPTKEIVRTLRSGGAKAGGHLRPAPKHVVFAADEAGIACDVTPTRNAKSVVLVSLTHLRVAADHPLAAPILGYQLERVRRLATADQAP